MPRRRSKYRPGCGAAQGNPGWVLGGPHAYLLLRRQRWIERDADTARPAGNPAISKCFGHGRPARANLLRYLGQRHPRLIQGSSPVSPTMRSARASRLRRLNFTVPLSQVKPTRFPPQQPSCAATRARGPSGVQNEGTSEQVSRVRPDGHPMHVEPLTDRDHALAVRVCSSDSVHLPFGQGCSSSSLRVRDDFRLVVSGTFWPVGDTEFCLIPRGTQPLEPLLGGRFDSTRVHSRRFGGCGHRFVHCAGELMNGFGPGIQVIVAIGTEEVLAGERVRPGAWPRGRLSRKAGRRLKRLTMAYQDRSPYRPGPLGEGLGGASPDCG